MEQDVDPPIFLLNRLAMPAGFGHFLHVESPRTQVHSGFRQLVAWVVRRQTLENPAFRDLFSKRLAPQSWLNFKCPSSATFHRSHGAIGWPSLLPAPSHSRPGRRPERRERWWFRIFWQANSGNSGRFMRPLQGSAVKSLQVAGSVRRPVHDDQAARSRMRSTMASARSRSCRAAPHSVKGDLLVVKTIGLRWVWRVLTTWNGTLAASGP